MGHGAQTDDPDLSRPMLLCCATKRVSDAGMSAAGCRIPTECDGLLQHEGEADGPSLLRCALLAMGAWPHVMHWVCMHGALPLLRSAFGAADPY